MVYILRRYIKNKSGHQLKWTRSSCIKSKFDFQNAKVTFYHKSTSELNFLKSLTFCLKCLIIVYQKSYFSMLFDIWKNLFSLTRWFFLLITIIILIFNFCISIIKFRSLFHLYLFILLFIHIIIFNFNFNSFINLFFLFINFVFYLLYIKYIHCNFIQLSYCVFFINLLHIFLLIPFFSDLGTSVMWLWPYHLLFLFQFVLSV